MNGDNSNINDQSTSEEGFSSRKQSFNFSHQSKWSPPQQSSSTSPSSSSLDTKTSLAIRLQQRRPRQILADQGIIAPLNQPGVYYGQVQRLERARKENYLNKAIQERPDRKYLVEKHILEDTAVSNTIVASQKNLKKAKLVDDLNEKILFRPGVIELVEKNIIPADNVQQAIKGGQIQYKKIADFVDEDSSDQFSPEQPPPPASSPPLTNFKITEQQPQLQQIPTSSNSEKIYVPNKSKASIGKTSSSSSLYTQASAHPYLSRLPSKGTSKSSNPFSTSSSSSSLTSSSSSSSHVARSSRKKKERPKVRKFKYHEYVPPDQQGKNEEKQAVMDTDSPYRRLLEQQQIYLKYQIMQTQYHSNAQRSGVETGASGSGASGSFNQQSMNGGPQQSQSSSVIKLECRAPSHHSVVTAGNKQQQFRSKLTTTKLEEMKVSELKEELKARSLKVTGTKEVLIERLRPHCVQIETPNFFRPVPDLQQQQRKAQVGGRVNGDDKIKAQQPHQQTKFDASTLNDQKVKERSMMILNSSNHAATAMMTPTPDNHNNKTANSTTTNGDITNSNGGGDLFTRKLSRMPQAETVKLVPKQENMYRLPTWNAKLSEGQVIINSSMLAQHPTLVQQQQAQSSDISNDMKDKMLLSQQKEIHQLKKRLKELHQSKELAKMEAHNSSGSSNQVQQLPLQNSDDQFALFSGDNGNNNNHQLATAGTGDEAFEMMDQQQATGGGADQNIEDIFEILNFDFQTGVNNNNNNHQQQHQILTNTESSGFPPNMCVINSKPPSGSASNTVVEVDDDFMSGIHSLMHSHHKDNLLGGSSGCMHDTTKILLETSGDALMDTSNFPIKMPPNSHHHHHHHHLYSPPRPSTCSSAESSLGGGITFTNSGERIRLSTSSLDDCNNQHQQHNSSLFNTSKMFTNNNNNRQHHNSPLIKSSSHEFLSIDNHHHPHHSSNHSSPLMSSSHHHHKHHQHQQQQQRSDDFLLHNNHISSSNEGGSGDLALSLTSHHHNNDHSQQLGWMDVPLLSCAASSSQQTSNPADVMSSASPLPLDDVSLLTGTTSSSNHNHHDGGGDLFDDFSDVISGGGGEKSDDVDMLTSHQIGNTHVTSGMVTSPTHSSMNSVSTSLFGGGGGGADMGPWQLGGGGSGDWESILGFNQLATDFTT